MTEQEGRELRGEKHLKSLPVSLTPADSIGRAHISPYSRYCFVHEQKTFMKIYVDPKQTVMAYAKLYYSIT